MREGVAYAVAMDTADIRAQITADTHLQTEINHALLAVADTLDTGSDRRVVRILTRTLQESWDAHVSFQDEVMFPIIEGRHGSKIKRLIERGRAEHADLSQLHGAIGRELDGMLHGALPDRPTIERLLRSSHAQRQTHLTLDAALASWLPDALTALETSLCVDWSSARPHLRFPLNLLGATRRLIPRLGGGRAH